MRGKATDGEPDWVSANRRLRRLTAVNGGCRFASSISPAVELGCRPIANSCGPAAKTEPELLAEIKCAYRGRTGCQRSCLFCRWWR